MDDLIRRLQSARVADRRGAAKHLRRHLADGLCQPLLEAFQKECRKRTWETQYHMALAIALQCQSPERARKAAVVVRAQLDLPLEPMVVLAIGHCLIALLRQEGLSDDEVEVMKSFLPHPMKFWLLAGGLRSIAMNEFGLSGELFGWMLKRMEEAPAEHAGRIGYWLLAATPGLSDRGLAGKFVESCVGSTRDDVARLAGVLQKQGRQTKWNVL